MNLNFDSRSDNSLSESPSSITTLDDLSRCMRLFAYVANEKHIRLGLGGFDLAMLPSPSTVVVVVVVILELMFAMKREIRGMRLGKEGLIQKMR